MIASMAWTVETLNEMVDAELAALPADMRARLTRISELIESVGLLNVKERVVILRAFIKKTEKTPPAEIELALQRAKELKP